MVSNKAEVKIIKGVFLTVVILGISVFCYDYVYGGVRPDLTKWLSHEVIMHPQIDEKGSRDVEEIFDQLQKIRISIVEYKKLQTIDRDNIKIEIQDLRNKLYNFENDKINILGSVITEYIENNTSKKNNNKNNVLKFGLCIASDGCLFKEIPNIDYDKRYIKAFSNYDTSKSFFIIGNIKNNPTRYSALIFFNGVPVIGSVYKKSISIQ